MNEFLSAYSMTRQQGDRDIEDVERVRQRGARRDAGRLMSQGNYQGASASLFDAGDLEAGQRLQAQGRQQQIGTALRDGNYDEAMQIPGVSMEEMQGIQQFRATRGKEEIDLAARKFETLAGVVAGLGQMPPERRLGEAQRLAPMFGMKPEDITPEMLTDEGLRTIAIRSMGMKEYLQLQRPQATPYGVVSGIDPVTQRPIPLQQAGQAQPQEEVLDALPPGASIRPRPSQASPQGGAERNQTPTVSYRSSQEAQAAIRQMVPGVGFNSGDRDAATNARVGGVPTSWHRKGRAWDLAPPRGMSMAQLAATMKAKGFRVLNEGDHVHVSW